MIENTEKLYDLITECKIMRLKTEEALAHIRKNGIKLSERTYRRYKKELEEKTQETMLMEGEQIRDSEYLQRLNTLKKIEHEYWSLYHGTKNESLKAKLLHSILEVQDPLAKYYTGVSMKAIGIRMDMEEQEKERQREENRKWTEQEEKELLKETAAC